MPLGYKHTEETKEKLRIAHLGKKRPPFSEEWKKNIGLGHCGIKHSIESRLRRSRLRKGDKSNLWEGGITEKSALIRESVEYKLWREAVFKRDDFTCQGCRVHGGDLEADHVKPFAHYPELRFELTNGRTLCKRCHRKTDTYGRKSIKLTK